MVVHDSNFFGTCSSTTTWTLTWIRLLTTWGCTSLVIVSDICLGEKVHWVLLRTIRHYTSSKSQGLSLMNRLQASDCEISRGRRVLFAQIACYFACSRLESKGLGFARLNMNLSWLKNVLVGLWTPLGRLFVSQAWISGYPFAGPSYCYPRSIMRPVWPGSKWWNLSCRLPCSCWAAWAQQRPHPSVTSS